MNLKKNIKNINFCDSVLLHYEQNSDFRMLIDQMEFQKFDFTKLESFQNIISKYWSSFSLCQGRYDKDCQQENKGFKFTLKFKNFYLFLQLTKCLHKNDVTLFKKNYLYSDFPQEWFGKDLKSQIKNIEDQGRNALLSFYAEILNKKLNVKKWLVLTGNFNTGKTFLTVAFANQFISRIGKKVIFINASNLFARFVERQINLFKFTDQLKSVDLLIVDDFGSENRLISFRDEFLLPLLNTRYNHNLLTILISNFSYPDLKKSYSFFNNKIEIIKVKTLFILIEKASQFLTLTKIFKE